ncbi:hypothetical protein N0V93_007892 [Gnomoniopsis smithogilvyi]|uniref:TauD/TfdA-like domain-containing protein n=1 Tax=Gnomoniopsis smithogilvyi TaxID=1191159 RepID=A0A9W9CU82_9PEZI|nr:hypothetical protein N0V93_007892 [Gnomoniopsis smithogilvyi]
MVIEPTTEPDPLCWSGTNYRSLHHYIIHLEDGDISELKTALEFWKTGMNGSPASVSKETFPLVHLASRLEKLALNLHKGSGFAVLRGLNTKDFSAEDNMLIYLGISSWVGSHRGAQNKKRDIVTHITDAKEWSNIPHEQRHGIHTNTALPFHNDMGCEILALQYREIAKQGGATSVSSATTICAELAVDHPEVLKELMTADWPVQLTAKPTRYARLPVLAFYEGRVLISVDPGRLGLHPATAGIRDEGCDLNESQIKALEVLGQVAEKHSISIAAQPGDILFVNNLALLHKRDAYLDAETRRHLVRLWLRHPDLSWEIPEEMKAPWKVAYGPIEEAGSFLVPRDRYQIVPEKEYKVPKYSSGSAAWLIDSDEQ